MKTGLILQARPAALDPAWKILSAQAWPTFPSLSEASACQAVAEYDGAKWTARLVSQPNWSPLFVDFHSARFSERSLRAMGRATPLARAIGRRGDGWPSVIDATAGLGGEAYVIAWLGCSTIAYEREPLIYALLVDGLRRADSSAAKRVDARFGDAIDLMTSAPADVVFLDPMFPREEERSALPKKNMQMFRALLRETPSRNHALFDAAMATARLRVIVKRAKGGEALASAKPDATFAGRTVRFDVYFTGASRAASEVR